MHNFILLFTALLIAFGGTISFMAMISLANRRLYKETEDSNQDSNKLYGDIAVAGFVLISVGVVLFAMICQSYESIEYALSVDRQALEYAYRDDRVIYYGIDGNNYSLPLTKCEILVISEEAFDADETGQFAILPFRDQQKICRQGKFKLFGTIIKSDEVTDEVYAFYVPTTFVEK